MTVTHTGRNRPFRCLDKLVLAVISGYGLVFGGNGCFWVVTSDYECIWGEIVCFFGVSSGYGFFWVVFGWLRLVLGGQKWLLEVMSGYQVFVFGSCLENAILTTSPPYKMSLPDKTSILTKRLLT